jgi:hypothetical protein
MRFEGLKRARSEKFLPVQSLITIGLAATAAFFVSCSGKTDEDRDVHHNGLTLRAERILGVDGSAPTNPLVLIPVTTDDGPFLFTYKVPVRTDVTTNRSRLVLLDNGKPAEAYLFTRTNSGYLLYWGSIFAAYGPHTLQVGLSILFHTNVYGAPKLETVTNIMQMDIGSTSFGKKFCVNGKLHIPSADYEIEIYDTNDVKLKTINGHTENGVVDEVWDLKTQDGKVQTRSALRALVYIIPTSTSTNGNELIRSNIPPFRIH